MLGGVFVYMSKLVYPARKCFVCHLKSATKCNGSRETEIWTGENGIKFLLVWIQGMLVQDQSGKFILEDHTGSCEIRGDHLPAIMSQVTSNGYALVIGELLQNGPIPVVKGVKMQDISSNEILRLMWPLEVEDMKHEFL